MAEFMLHHTHPAEDCGEIFPELQNVAQSLKGKNFFCTCPSGDHGGFFQVEAGSPEDRAPPPGDHAGQHPGVSWGDHGDTLSRLSVYIGRH